MLILTGMTSLIIVAISLVEFIVLTRFYPVEVFGEFAIVMLSISLVGLFGNGLFSQIFLKRKYICMPSLLPFLPYLIGIQFAFSCALLSLFLPRLLDNLVYNFVLISVSSNLIFSCLESSYIKRGNIQKINIWQILAVSVGALGSTTAAYFSLAEGLVVMTAALGLKSIVLLSGLYRKKLLGMRQASFTRRVKYYRFCILKYGGYFYSSCLGYLVVNTDRWYAVAISSTENFALYSKAYQFLNVPVVFLNRMVAKDLQYRLLLGRSIVRVAKILLISAIAITVILFSFGEYLVVFVLGDQWRATGSLLVMLGMLLVPKFLLKLVDVYIRANHEGSIYLGFHFLQFSALGMLITLLLPATVEQLAKVLIISSYLSFTVAALMLVFKRNISQKIPTE